MQTDLMFETGLQFHQKERPASVCGEGKRFIGKARFASFPGMRNDGTSAVLFRQMVDQSGVGLGFGGAFDQGEIVFFDCPSPKDVGHASSRLVGAGGKNYAAYRTVEAVEKGEVDVSGFGVGFLDP